MCFVMEVVRNEDLCFGSLLNRIFNTICDNDTGNGRWEYRMSVPWWIEVHLTANRDNFKVLLIHSENAFASALIIMRNHV